jgi:hypothetical protein
MKTFNLIPMAALIAVVASAVSSPARADMGNGSAYNQGSYACENSENGLEGRFTFNRGAELTIKGAPVALTCIPARSASIEVRKFLASQFRTNAADVCTGESAKGQVLVATSNSMGIVQMSAFLFDSSGQVKANADLGCKETHAGPKSAW